MQKFHDIDTGKDTQMPCGAKFLNIIKKGDEYIIYNYITGDQRTERSRQYLKETIADCYYANLRWEKLNGMKAKWRNQ